MVHAIAFVWSQRPYISSKYSSCHGYFVLYTPSLFGYFRSKLDSVCRERGNLNLFLFFPFRGLPIELTSVPTIRKPSLDESPSIPTNSIGGCTSGHAPIISRTFWNRQEEVGGVIFNFANYHASTEAVKSEDRKSLLLCQCSITCLGNYVGDLFRAFAIRSIQNSVRATWSLESCAG